MVELLAVLLKEIWWSFPTATVMRDPQELKAMAFPAFLKEIW
jgi:hypothetical protein